MGDFGLHIPRSHSPSSIPHSLSQNLDFFIYDFFLCNFFLFYLLPLRFLHPKFFLAHETKVTVQQKEMYARVTTATFSFIGSTKAYDIVMSSLRESDKDESYSYNTKSYEYADGCDEPFKGMNDSSWELWEELMGWKGAGIRDYSSHITPYI